MAVEKKEKQIVRIRKGLNGWQCSECREDGRFVRNAESIEQIKGQYEYEIKHRMIKFIKELDLYPEGEEIKNKVYGYARVSTVGQAKDGNSLDAQKAALIAAGATEIFVDTFTGTKMERPEFDRLNALLKGGDTLIVTKLDRFARTVGQASEQITDLIDRRITVNVLNLGILDNSSTSVLMRNVLLAFSQFERDMIVERTQEGRAIARTKEGYREGRPQKYTGEQLRHAMDLLNSHSYTQVEKMTGISKSTLIRAKKKTVEEECSERATYSSAPIE